MDSAPAKVVFFLILLTALAVFQAWRAAAAVEMPQPGRVGTALVGLVGALGETEGVEPDLTVAALDARCGEGKWSVWYELGTSGDVVPGSIVVACE